MPKEFLKKLKSKIREKIRRVFPLPEQVLRNRFHALCKKIYSTKPIKIRPNPDCEIHILTSTKHVRMALLALKSFLRFYQDVSVVIHGDGTLKKEDEALLRKHIQGCRIILKREADPKISEALRDYPALNEFRSKRVNLIQAFDFNLLSKAKKIMAMDSDVLFLRKPEEIIQWFTGSNREVLYSYEEKPIGPVIGGRYISEAEGVPFKFQKKLCCGLVCYYPELFDYKLVEIYRRYIQENSHEHLYYAQPIFALCIGKSSVPAHPLPGSYQNQQTFGEGAVFRHYWNSLEFHPQYAEDVRLVLRELLKNS